MQITRTSPLTHKVHTQDIPVTQEQLGDWQSGSLIEHAMPDLTPDQREFIKTGITASEWDTLFNA